MNKFTLPLLVITAGLASCATVPTPLKGTYSTVTPKDAAATTNSADAVRWGGEIIKVEPKADSTCFEILGRELDASARPISRDPSAGRFMACRAGFYDPEVFERGRELTVVGHIDGTHRGKVGEYDYTYPKVAADAIYLWPKRSRYANSPYYDPWLYGYGGPWGFGPYWGPYWGGTTVIVRGHPH